MSDPGLASGLSLASSTPPETAAPAHAPPPTPPLPSANGASTLPPAPLSSTLPPEPASIASDQPPPTSKVAATTPPALAAAATVVTPAAAVVTPLAAVAAQALAIEPEPTWSENWAYLPSWMTSMVVHLSFVLLLAIFGTVHHFSSPNESPVVSTDASDGPGGPGDDMLDAAELPGSGNLEDAPTIPIEQLPELPPGDAVASLIGPITADLPKAAELPAAGGGGAAGGQAIAASGGGGEGLGLGSGFSWRLKGQGRADAVRHGGGTPESEYAVQMALRWLAEHQNYDGSWTFEHQKSPKCHGSCGDPGFIPGKIAATSMALLPFLGCGQTHQEGEHKKKVEMGLRFLVRSMEMQGELGSLYEMGGQMYGHGLAAITLCEAYGMTHDPSLAAPAQAAANFIVAAQDSNGGGWRYRPGEPGDTSVVGWQLMALKSAKMAYLKVPDDTFRKAGYFLDSVQSERGSTYGYQEPSARRPATTAIGLLSRMYLGWPKEHEGLQRGVHILSTLGPSTDQTAMRNNMYYNYYATQVMHHYGGYPWQRWNAVMRDYLIRTQANRGHEIGSWYLDGDIHTAAGGRLYCTSMAAMTLEVYYRYMPLYREQVTK